MQLGTFLHVSTMFLALTIIAGRGALLVTTLIRRRDIDGLRTYFRLAPRIDTVGAILFVAVMTPYLQRIKAALDANEGGEPGTELQAPLAAPNSLVSAAAVLVIIGLIIWDMVFRPTF